MPTKVSAIGGKFMFDDDQETPNTLNVSYEFNAGGKKKMMVFEVRHWMTNHEANIGGQRAGNTVGNIFYGSKGYLAIDGYDRCWTYLGREQQRTLRIDPKTGNVIGDAEANKLFARTYRAPFVVPGKV